MGNRGVIARAVVGAAISIFCYLVSPAAARVHGAVGSRNPSTSDPFAGFKFDIPITKFVLKNGLTVLVSEDHSSPLVATVVQYHVGSKDEPKGKSGFAHLFEHLMFNGSENFNDDFFKATEKIGATQQNGLTGPDDTIYFQTVPRAALDTILWLESDRMGHLLRAVDQAKLDEQRGVVENEKRVRIDNVPYGRMDELITQRMWPEGHPYDHLPIGSMKDLDAASLSDVKDWFHTWYGPSNAVLALAGDITPAEAAAKVEKYFGDIPPGSPVVHAQSWVVRRTGTIRDTITDRVSQPRLMRVWNVAEYRSPDHEYLDLLAYVLAGDDYSRLYRRLVATEPLATSVNAYVLGYEIGGQFRIDVMIKQHGDVDRVEKIIDDELRRLIANGPTPDELSHVRTAMLARWVRSFEYISTKAQLPADSQLMRGSPDAWKDVLHRFQAATRADLRRVGRTWLSDGDYVLTVLPFGDLAASGAGTDRKKMPMPSSTVLPIFPPVERATLANGMKLLVAHRGKVPMVTFNLLFDNGVAADFAKSAPDIGQFGISMMIQATTTQSNEKLTKSLGSLGASLGAEEDGLETGSITLSALRPVLKPSVSLFADVIMHPAFVQTDLDRLKNEFAARVAAARKDPRQISARVSRTLMFGRERPYGRLDTEASYASISRNDLLAFHNRWVRPNNATLIVTGDTSLAEIRPMIETAFATWQQAPIPDTTAPVAEEPLKSVIYLVDKPEAAQSAIRANVIVSSISDGDEVARKAFGTTLGGAFTSRLNMRLREEKHWAYGAGSGFTAGVRGARIFFAGAPVQTDKTAESMTEIAEILKGIVSDRKIDSGEFAIAKDNMSLGLVSDWSTASGVAACLADEVSAHLQEGYCARYPEAISTETIDSVNGAGQALLANKPITWVIVGDRAKIEDKIRALNLGEVRIVDADGNVIPPK